MPTLIISDEIHSDIVYEGHKQTSFISLDTFADHAIIMNSPSKTFNVAALYSAYVIIKNKALREQFEVVSSDYHLDYNMLGLEALMACYNECDYYVDAQNAYFSENIALVREFLQKEIPEAVWIEPEGTYLLWIDFSRLGLPQEKLLQLFESAAGQSQQRCQLWYRRKRALCVWILPHSASVLTEALNRVAKVYQTWYH